MSSKEKKLLTVRYVVVNFCRKISRRDSLAFLRRVPDTIWAAIVVYEILKSQATSTLRTEPIGGKCWMEGEHNRINCRVKAPVL